MGLPVRNLLMVHLGLFQIVFDVDGGTMCKLQRSRVVAILEFADFLRLDVVFYEVQNLTLLWMPALAANRSIKSKDRFPT